MWLRALVVMIALVVCTRIPRLQAQAPAFAPRVVDLHVDLPYQITAKQRDAETGDGNFVAKWLRASGVAAAVLPLYVPKNVHPEGPRYEDFERVFTESGIALRALPAWLMPGFEPAGIPEHVEVSPCAALPRATRTVGFYSFEGLEPLAFDLPKVDVWVERGVRLFGLVHSYDTQVATSSGYQFTDATVGLTRLGKQLVEKIYDAGGVVDVSHASDATVSDVLAYALARKVPVVATHSNARAVANHPRNLTDAQLRSIAATGGVIGVAFHARFLTGGTHAALSDVVKHILHVKKVAGIDAVAIGSDFEGGIRPPPELQDVRGFPVLANALLGAGLSRAEVEQVLGLNALRVLCPKAPLWTSGSR